MSVDTKTVQKVAKLARLSIPEERIDALAGEMNEILGWIEQLNEVDISGVEAMASTVDVQLPLREDAPAQGPTGGGQPENIVANAPVSEDNFFVVPKVVE